MSAGNRVCVCSIDGVPWRLEGEDDRALAALVEGTCPLCPAQALDGDRGGLRSAGATCGCCGSLWRWSDGEVEIAPGPRVEVRAQA